MKTTIDKAELKKQIIYNVKTLYRKTIDEATPQQVFQAVSYALKDDIIDQWIATHKEIERTDAKTLYYLSMEFLMGRALGNNILNLCAQDEVKDVEYQESEEKPEDLACIPMLKRSDIRRDVHNSKTVLLVSNKAFNFKSCTAVFSWLWCHFYARTSVVIQIKMSMRHTN